MELRKDRMTHKERMEALWNYQKLDRVPIHGFCFGFCTRNAGYTVRSAYDNPQETFEATLWTAEQYGWEQDPQWFAHTTLGGWDFGGEIKMPDSDYQGALAIASTPVKTEEDVGNLKMPDPRTAGGINYAMEFAKLQEKSGIPITFYIRSPFTSAANICGIEQFCRWMMKKPELCHRLLRMNIDHVFNVLRIWADTFGAEKLFFLMSSPNEANQIISPKHFEKFAIPYHVELQQGLHTMGIKRRWFHICGEQNLNLPHLAEISHLWPHPSLLSFGHEVDLEVAAKYFPDDIIYGNIEPAVIQTGTPQQVYELSRIAIEKGKKIDGGFMLAPGCEMPIWSPPVNVFAMTKAVDDFGWYE